MGSGNVSEIYICSLIVCLTPLANAACRTAQEKSDSEGTEVNAPLLGGPAEVSPRESEIPRKEIKREWEREPRAGRAWDSSLVSNNLHKALQALIVGLFSWERKF